jgi:hypothetical protein
MITPATCCLGALEAPAFACQPTASNALPDQSIVLYCCYALQRHRHLLTTTLLPVPASSHSVTHCLTASRSVLTLSLCCCYALQRRRHLLMRRLLPVPTS